MPCLQDAIMNIVKVFMENTGEDGILNKDELKKLMEKEFDCPEFKASLPTFDFDKAMERSDRNRDGAIDFREFSKCVAFMANCCYNKKMGKDTGCGKKGASCK